MWSALKRLSQWVKALFNRGMDKLEDPEIMLDQARRDMQEALVENREKAVQAIAQKNRLERLVEEQTKAVASLEAKAEQALKMGNRDLARSLLREKMNLSQGMESLQASLESAEQTVDQVKVAIKRQEEQVRAKLAESLALKAQWKQAQIQNAISKTLEGLTFEDNFDNEFNRARDRVKDMQAEAAARQEMHAGSLQGKVMELEDQSMDLEADEELKKLEERLGLTTASMPAVTAEEAELAELEARIQLGQGTEPGREQGMSP